jgi:hypothetical protein
MTCWYFQPETFNGGTLVVTLNPFYSKREVEFKIPSDIDRAFKMVYIPWPDTLPEEMN